MSSSINKNTSTWDKIKAGARLTLNVASAVATFTPVGAVAKLGRAAKVVNYLNKANSLRRQTEGTYQSLKGARDSLRTLTSRDKRISNKERMAALGKLALTAGGMTFGKFPGKHPLSGKLGFAAKNGSIGKAKRLVGKLESVKTKNKERIGMRNMNKAMKAMGYSKDPRFKKAYHGIDGVFRDNKGNLVLAEAKYSKANKGLGLLKRTQKGRQMSEDWVKAKAKDIRAKAAREFSQARKDLRNGKITSNQYKNLRKGLAGGSQLGREIMKQSKQGKLKKYLVVTRPTSSGYKVTTRSLTSSYKSVSTAKSSNRSSSSRSSSRRR